MASAAIAYRVLILDRHAHLFQVTLTIAQPAVGQRLSLPVWIPGSYLIREFSKTLQNLQASQGKKTVALTQQDKCNWQADCVIGQPLVLTYEVYAFDNSVRTAWLDASRGFFNGTSLFLQVAGQASAPHEVTLVADKALVGWQVATGLTPAKADKNGFGRYLAADYDELVDCPVEMGTFWSDTFVAGGLTHRFVVAGAPPSFDGARLMADTKEICETEIRFWHGAKKGRKKADQPPHTNYLFMLNVVDDGYGGLEHRNSTALICMRKDLPRLSHPALTPASTNLPDAKPAVNEGYTQLLGLISHEYFHTWNVKRLRPAEFARYDYGQENYTELLWFFEGFTSYYDDLLLHRAGLIDETTYLRLLNKTINQVQQTPGRLIQTVAQASFDAWVKYYRQDENTPNATVSYYTKGALVALCLDLTLRSEGKTTLDEVMRALWQRCQGGPMTEADVLTVLETLAGRSLSSEVAQWVHSTTDLPLQALLEQHGVALLNEPAQLAQRLGVRVSEGNAVQIKTVLRGGAAEQAGFAAGDEWLGVQVGQGKTAIQWRLNKLDDLLLYADASPGLVAMVARDKRILNLQLTLPTSVNTWLLVARDKTRVNQWLKPV
jgi:predicted metalloprotease with PDZ domain